MKHLYSILFVLLASLGVLTLGTAQRALNQVEPSTTKEITIYPNPATDYFSLRIDRENITHVSITNIVGKEVKRLKYNANQPYNIQDLRRGIYFVKIYDSEEKMVKALRFSKS